MELHGNRAIRVQYINGLGVKSDEVALDYPTYESGVFDGRDESRPYAGTYRTKVGAPFIAPAPQLLSK